MGQREDIVKFAVGELGYKEGVNNNTKYGKWYGMNNNAWCAMFVSWCAAQAKVSTDVILKFAYVPYGVTFFKKLGRFKTRGSYIPQPGDIIFYGSAGSTGAHVGIVEKVDGQYVYAIEGNTSRNGNNSNGDGVYRRVRTLSNSWIMGYGVPAYKEEEEVIKKDQTLNIDGEKVILSAANIEDENYFRIRDIAPVLGFKVGWDSVKREVVLTKE